MTPTPTPSVSSTPGASSTPTPTLTATSTLTPTITISPTPTLTATATETPTPTTTPTSTVTPTSTLTPTITVSPTITDTPTSTPTSTPTPMDTGSIIEHCLQLYLNAATSSSYPNSGTEWYDLSHNAYTASIVGGITHGSNNFNFNGVGQYVNTHQSLSSENFSVGAWFRNNSGGGANMILSKETIAGSPWNYRIWLANGTIYADVSPSVGTISSLVSPTATYQDGQWYLVMFTRDATTWRLYVNGAEISNKPNDVFASVTNSQELWIGRSYINGGSYQYLGDIGQVFIYDCVLSASEILHNFDDTKDTYYPPPAPTPTITTTPTVTPTITITPTITDTPTNTPTPTATATPTYTPSATQTVTPTITPTPSVTSTPYPEICVPPVLPAHDYKFFESNGFPLWRSSTTQLNDNQTEQVDPCGRTLNVGDIVQLSASQVYYSFDYYAIYPPHTIYSAGAFWYTTVKGFTASYDPYTYVRIGEFVDITGSNAKIKAIYR